MNGYCCEKFRHAREDFDGPIGWDSFEETYYIALYSLTPSKKAISRIGREFSNIDSCPWCGAKLGESDES